MKQFLKQTLASFIGSVAGLLFLFALSTGGLFLFIMALMLSSNNPQIENQSVLVFDLSSQITDSNNQRPLPAFLNPESSNNLSLRQVINAINKGAEDKKISALFLDGSKGNINLGYGSLAELKTALENFKSSGKKIITYHNSISEKDYYLSSIADEINLNPLGALEMNGLSTSQLFFASALDKYGIGVQVIRVGKYKSAVEPFTRDNYSTENREQTKELLTNLWDSYLNEVSENNGLTSQNINNIADSFGIIEAKKAQELKLIDKTAYIDEIRDDFRTITNTEKDNFPQVTIKQYLSRTTTNQGAENKIAILYLEGNIVDGEGNIGEVGGLRTVAEIKKIREDENIKGVIVRINSPGGSALASELIARELDITAQEKPIVISMADVAASGGYWIATSGEKIFANDGTITGSIGVFGLLFNLENLTKNNGINSDVIKTNQLADLSNNFRSKNPQEIAVYQESVNQIYDLFLERVAKARNLSIQEVNNIAQGRVWLGNNAQEIGLVDDIGGLESAINYLTEKLTLGDNYEIKEYPELRNWENELLTAIENTDLAQNKLDSIAIFNQIWEYNSDLDLANILKKPNRVYSILPFKFDIN
ncbi:MAG: signal peptide peptidase SppA [Cyanobacterium sp. T60_A2020_053]|nr:signal peptide peptidase SppA [Cyanobacterium sp. T60_A2020_053]